MTENRHDPQRNMRHDDPSVGSSRPRATRAIGWLALVLPVALAAVTVAGCSSSTGSTAVRAASDTPAASTSTSAPTMAPTPMPAPTPDSTPKVTVTVTPPPPPVAQPAAGGLFRSPSGNITCTLSTPGGVNAARCEVVDHTWVAPPASPNCHLNWGDRFELTQGGPAGFNCYGQEFPVAEQTLGYGQTRSLGTITCDSEPAGITCTDSSTGHYFRIWRESYQLA